MPSASTAPQSTPRAQNPQKQAPHTQGELPLSPSRKYSEPPPLKEPVATTHDFSDLTEEDLPWENEGSEEQISEPTSSASFGAAPSTATPPSGRLMGEVSRSSQHLSSQHLSSKAPAASPRSVSIPAPSSGNRSVSAPHEQALDEYFSEQPFEASRRTQQDDYPSSEASDFDDSQEPSYSGHADDANYQYAIPAPSPFEGPFEEHRAAPSSATTTPEIAPEEITPILPPQLRESAQAAKTLTPGSITQSTFGLRSDPSPLQSAADVPEPIHSSDLSFLDATATPEPSRGSRKGSLAKKFSDLTSGDDPYRALSSQPEPLKRLNAPGTWSSTLMLGLPVIGALIFFGVLGFTLQANPEIASALSKKAFPAAPQIAPSELFIKNTNFRKVLLDSGESVYVVSGKILNDSPSTFRDVIIEGILFDANGAPLLRTRASASSALAKGRVRSLTPEIIERSQRAAAPSDYRMSAGDGQEFTLVMDESGAPDAVLKARYFSARVYSVRY